MNIRISLASRRSNAERVRGSYRTETTGINDTPSYQRDLQLKNGHRPG